MGSAHVTRVPRVSLCKCFGEKNVYIAASK